MLAHPCDTPTPPSQSYPALLQTSLRPSTTTAAYGRRVDTKSRLSQQIRADGMDDDSSFASSDSGELGEAAVGARVGKGVNNENEDPHMHSLGYGDAGMGMGTGTENKNRFTDLHNVRRQTGLRKHKNNGTAVKRTRVDDFSDATFDSSTSDADYMTSSDDNEFSARLALKPQNNNHQYPSQHTSTPFPNANSNVSKSAFDSMARELRKEFERIMDSGKAARTYTSDQNMPRQILSTSPAQKRYSANNNHTTAAPNLRPRGVTPKRPSPIAYKSGNPPERQDMRTFGQELPIYRQASPQVAVPVRSPNVASSASPKHALSPFQVSSVAQASGLLPPNNTRATSTSPVNLQQQKQQASYPSPARSISSYAALRVPDITGLTEGLTSPSRATSGPSSHLHLPSNGSPKSRSQSTIKSVEGE